MIYITDKGTRQTTRPRADLSMDERRQILLELETVPAKEVRAKWNVSNLVLSHLRWHDTGLLKGVPTNQSRIRDLRRSSPHITSPEVAAELGIDIKLVNRLW